jgi:hypothetical protein
MRKYFNSKANQEKDKERSRSRHKAEVIAERKRVKKVLEGTFIPPRLVSTNEFLTDKQIQIGTADVLLWLYG